MDKKRAKGVRICLARRVRIPPWLRHSGKVSIDFEERQGERVRVLTVIGGKTTLIDGGKVEVKVPPKRSPVATFVSGQVLQIEDL